jgi:predicted aldo/keto reductase-like oxidoreductase
VKQALGPKGAIETMLKAKEEGKVKHLGFSAHTTMGALEAMKGFKFDTVMFPINFVEYYKMGFGKPVLELANAQGAAVIAIKPMCGGGWPKGMERTRKWWYRPLEEPEEISLGLRFTLSLKGVVTGIPPGFLDLLEKAIPAGRAYEPISLDEVKKVKEMAAARESVFRRDEEKAKSGVARNEPTYPDSPHECCYSAYA